MSAKAIREATGKDILNRALNIDSGAATSRFASVNPETKWGELLNANPWLETTVSDIFLSFVFVLRMQIFVQRMQVVDCAVKANCDVNWADTRASCIQDHKIVKVILTFWRPSRFAQCNSVLAPF